MTGQERYSSMARWLHWTVAALVIANILIGIFHDGLGSLFPAMPIHKAIGVTVLALTMVRIGWRLTHRPPPLPGAMPGWERVLAVRHSQVRRDEGGCSRRDITRRA